MRDALSQVVWGLSVGVFVVAACGLLAVLHFGRASEAPQAGSMLASLALWAKMTSLALVLVLLVSATAAVGCLVWLDLWRVYKGDPPSRTSPRDRRIALRNASTIAADLGRWRALQKAASLAAGHKPLPFWGWCLLGVAEAFRQCARLGRRLLRASARGLGQVFELLVVLGWLAGKGLKRVLRRGLRELYRAGLWLRPRLLRALRLSRYYLRRLIRASGRGLRRASPHLAAGARGSLARGAQAGRWAIRLMGTVAVEASSAMICCGIWLWQRASAGVVSGIRSAAAGTGRIARNVRQRHSKAPTPSTRYQVAWALEHGDNEASPEPRATPSSGRMAICPCCGRSKPMPPEGSYVCGQCGAQFVVTNGQVAMQASCPGCGKKRPVSKAGKYQCSQCKLTFRVTPTGSVVDASCPGCGKYRPVDRLGRFECSSCKMEFEVTRQGAMVEVSCPICRRSRNVPRLGRFECSDCGSVFRAEQGSTVLEASCPSCSQVQDVPGAGIYSCSGCENVFTVAGPDAPVAQPKDATPEPTAQETGNARQEQQRILNRFMATEKLRRRNLPDREPADAQG